MEETPPAVRTSSPSPSPVSQLTPPQGSQTPNKSEVPAPESNEPLHSVESRSSEFSPSVSYTITIPSYSGWFSSDKIHETEWRMLPEFFDGKSPSKNPSVYKYYRDSIVGRFRSNPSRKTTFTEVRRGLVGDVGSIRRVFDFLEIWGLINYTPSSKPLPKEKKEATETLDRKDGSRKICSICKELCGSVCFVADKSDIVLCSRCFVRGNYRAGVHSADFKRVAISDETKTEWTDKETLHLVEAILHFGEDWKKVSEHVGSKNEKDCVARFIKLPFGEQFMGPPEFKEADQLHVECFHNNVAGENPSKQRRLTPLADASNPIMAQVSFLAAMVGPEVAASASQAAIAALDEIDLSCMKSPNKRIRINDSETEEAEVLDKDEQTLEALKEAAAEARSQLEKEQQDVEKSISNIVEVQMREIQEKLAHFEKMDLLMEKDWRQLKHLKDLVFADQLSLLQEKPRLQRL